MGRRSYFGTISGAVISVSRYGAIPSLLRMEHLKEAIVHQMVDWNGNQTQWNITFLRRPNDQEEKGVLSLLALLGNTNVAFEGDNEILWRFGP